MKAPMKPTLRNLIICLSILSVGLLTGCNDRRAKGEPAQHDTTIPAIETVAFFQHNAQQTVAYQMVMSGGSLYLTGTPFAFTRWDFSGNPESPQKIFAASDMLLNPAQPDLFADSDLGPWTPQAYGFHGLAVKGKYAYMSGNIGMSVIDMNSPSRPKEIARYQGWDDQNDLPIADDRYIFSALLPHPSQSRLWAFHLLESFYDLNIATPSRLSHYSSETAYPSEGQGCCVRRAAQTSSYAFVAYGTKLIVYKKSGGKLVFSSAATEAMSRYEAQAIYATSRYLYVHHQPTTTGGSQMARGVYVLTHGGAYRAFLPIFPLVFAVNENDTHVYVNDDNQRVRALRINWQAAGQ